VFNGVDERKLLPAIVLSFCLFVAGLILLASGLGGCAVRHLPGGGTQPATRLEQVLAWNASLAQANDGFAENVIALERGGIIGIAEAKTILVGEAKIAEADKRLTDRIRAAAVCAVNKAGGSATALQLDQAGSDCAQISGPGIAADLNLILGTLADLNATGLLAVKDDAKRQALSDLLATISGLVNQIYGALERASIVPARAAEVR
jgi:hypothetical protein